MRPNSEWAGTMRRTLSMVCCSISLTVLFAGCGGGNGDIEKVPLYPASGMVTMDGEPFGPVSLRFVPEEVGERSFIGKANDLGLIDTVTTYEIGDGAPAGTYKVTVFSSGGTGKEFPAVYESEKSTPLKVIIADVQGAGANNMDIQLDSKAGKGDSKNPTMGHFSAEQMDAAKAGTD